MKNIKLKTKQIIQITSTELFILLFYIPIFFLKLLNILSNNILLQAVSIVSAIFVVLLALKRKYSFRELLFWLVIFLLSGIVMLCSKKQGLFFTVLLIFAMRDTEYKKLVNVLFVVAILGVLLSMYFNREATASVRYINGAWTIIYKRSNILYVAFFALSTLFLMRNSQKLSIVVIVINFILSTIMYYYSGSRSGLYVSLFLTVILILFKIKFLQNKKVVHILCALFPTLCFIFSVYSGVRYGKDSWLNDLNTLLQGRIAQNSIFLEEYDIKFFGQYIFEHGGSVYRVLDCTYIDMLLAYGGLVSVVWCFISYKVILNLCRQKRFVEVAIILAYAIYGLTETFLPNCFLNLSLLIYSDYINAIIKKFFCSKRQKMSAQYSLCAAS